MNRSEILDGLSRRERGAIQSAQAHSANAARRQDWQRICDSYVATLTPVTDCSAVSTTEMPQHENIVTTPVLEFGDTSIPTFAPDSLLLGLQSQTSTPVIQPERTGFDYQTKNSHGLPGGMIGNFDRPPDVQARIEASNRAEVIGEAIDHPDMSGLSPEMRMAARINNAVRHVDQGIHNLSEGISHGVANISKGFSRARETFSSIWGRAKSPSHSPRSIAEKRRMAIAAVVASGLMTSCAGSIPVPPDQGPGQIQQVTPMVPNKALGIIPVPSGSGNPTKFPDISINGRPLFDKATAILIGDGTCTVAVPEDLQRSDRMDGANPTALIVERPVFEARRNILVGPDLGSKWYLLMPTLKFANGEPFNLPPMLVTDDLVDSGPYTARCYGSGTVTNFQQTYTEVSGCTSTPGNPIVSERNRQPHLTCTPVDRFTRALPDGSYVKYGTINHGYVPGVSQMPQALPDARNATITPARPTATPARPIEQSVVQQNPKGPIYSAFDFKCNTGNGSVQLGDKLGKDVVQRVVLDNDSVNELCITGTTKDGEPTGAVVYRRPPDGQFVLTGRLQYDGASECFRDPKTSICLGQGGNYFTK